MAASVLCGFGQVGRERLFDQQRQLALRGEDHRVDVQVLVGGDDHRVDLRAREQLAVIGGDEIRAAFLAHDFAALGIDLGEADPVHLGMAGGELAANQPDATRADDGEADAFGFLSLS